jgi:hypothetical protein
MYFKTIAQCCIEKRSLFAVRIRGNTHVLSVGITLNYLVLDLLVYNQWALSGYHLPVLLIDVSYNSKSNFFEIQQCVKYFWHLLTGHSILVSCINWPQ